jgi:hypothetical protein
MMPDIIKEGGIWAEFVEAHTNILHARKCISLFYDEIVRAYPHMEDPIGSLGTLRHCQFRCTESADVGWTACIGANTPCSKTSTVLERHLDATTKLFFGLLYLRHPDDTSEGGDLLVYDGDKLVQTVKYESNTLVLGLNTPRSFHGVSDRQPTPYPRVFANLYAEVRNPLYVKQKGF